MAAHVRASRSRDRVNHVTADEIAHAVDSSALDLLQTGSNL